MERSFRLAAEEFEEGTGQTLRTGWRLRGATGTWSLRFRGQGPRPAPSPTRHARNGPMAHPSTVGRPGTAVARRIGAPRPESQPRLAGGWFEFEACALLSRQQR